MKKVIIFLLVLLMQLSTAFAAEPASVQQTSIEEKDAKMVDFIVIAESNIRTGANRKIVYTIPKTGAWTLTIDRIEKGWCHIADGLVIENEDGRDVKLRGSRTGYWVHNSQLTARGMGNGGVTLYAEPYRTARVVFSETSECNFCPIELRGDWVRVRIIGTTTEGWLPITEICSNPLTNCC